MDLLETFVRESDELIDEFEAGLVQLEEANAGGEIVHALFRAAHTLKGNAGMVGLTDFVRYTHVLENVLGRVRDGALGVDSRLIDCLLSAVDVVRSMVHAAARKEALATGEHYAATLTVLETFMDPDAPPANAEPLHEEPRDLLVEITLECAPEAALVEAQKLLADIGDLGKLRELTPALGPGQREYRFVLHTDARRVDIEAITLFANAKLRVTQPAKQEPAASPATPAPAAAEREAASPGRSRANVKVDAERLDSLVDLTCEMVIASARAEQLSRDPRCDPRLRADAMENLVELVREVQERTMGLRMVAVRDTFGRFSRPIRDIARELGKDVEFETHGMETELDRKLLDQLADPLKHVIRNAIAHGIETPSVREASGKPRAGRLLLSATQENGAAVIEVRDDGAGIDRARVLAKAVERGLVAAGSTLNERQIYELLFQPGFSTAQQVNEIAGRGVGLDVLKRSVDALRGTIDISSELGKGTAFRIRLPVTLAIVDGMHVKVGSETLTIPLASVVELLDGRVTPIGMLEDSEYLDLRGQVLPVLRLARVLNLAGESSRSEMIVVVQSERRRFGVVVDAVIGLARAVIKPLERSYAFIHQADRDFVKPAGVSGATVLGDGGVGLILDVPGLEAMAFDA
ncbi:MAG TPA: chemotaxis protein CheA [Polyangiales bacterium]|nr:chemotaxis protein CheA [Polyangiales bacterium]